MRPHFYYSADFNIPLPEKHRFPGHKYELLRRELLARGLVDEDQLHLSPEAEEADILLAHDREYVSALSDGSIDPKVMRRIGFPWSEQIPRRGRRTVGGAIEAARTALRVGLSGQLAGGTHHAHAGFGAGFCIYNDFAVVAKKALAEGWVDRIAIIDLDVHQGDGNAAILGGDARIFILDAYGAKNFPFRKVPATLDIPFEDNPGDDAYLTRVAEMLPQVWNFAPDLVLYQAGVDPLVHDRLGRMDLSYDGLMERDRLVLEGCRQRGIPCSMGIGGGYANPIDPTVTAYANTYAVAKAVYGY
ncbi:histone deacetylase [Parvularcula flava]|uniref:Histone deacetylase n=1 Tax=Aquisalinus luteolus TaxID=1566827 RepID=A0A8J3EPG9_9PROT|nr:histone deacetylase [Aquisalinus luteolus]NHK28152.1 histone deacetylase [Aquisalinus luteolus]GGH97619.1 histone deacetylase [Aquisalinus luteolus]